MFCHKFHYVNLSDMCSQQTFHSIHLSIIGSLIASQSIQIYISLGRSPLSSKSRAHLCGHSEASGMTVLIYWRFHSLRLVIFSLKLCLGWQKPFPWPFRGLWQDSTDLLVSSLAWDGFLLSIILSGVAEPISVAIWRLVPTRY